MKKSFRLSNLDCANCAAKMERAIQKIPGVVAVSIQFMTQRLALEAEEAAFPEILLEADKIIRKIEPDCKILR